MEPHQHPRETAVSGALFLQGNLCKSAGGNVVAACGRVSNCRSPLFPVCGVGVENCVGLRYKGDGAVQMKPTRPENCSFFVSFREKWYMANNFGCEKNNLETRETAPTSNSLQ